MSKPTRHVGRRRQRHMHCAVRSTATERQEAGVSTQREAGTREFPNICHRQTPTKARQAKARPVHPEVEGTSGMPSARLTRSCSNTVFAPPCRSRAVNGRAGRADAGRRVDKEPDSPMSLLSPPLSPAEDRARRRPGCFFFSGLGAPIRKVSGGSGRRRPVACQWLQHPERESSAMMLT